ncbi:MAG: DNA polymerase IV, partial [Candidatus Eisenbacteria bacterium]|nr:DNA polymerase IV [Candidatus Eisenbacteria bacterium]
MKSGERTILHLDMDAYFAEIEVLANPRLRGRPLVVGGRPGDRGVVSTASYEARAFGVRSGMPLTKARSLCPQAVFIPCDPSKYAFFTSRILKCLLQVTPRTEMWSIDEAFLDLSDKIPWRADRFLIPQDSDGGRICRGGPPLWRAARAIQAGLHRRFRLSCSLGGGPNKLVAKMATGLQKPNGVTLLSRSAYCQTFWPRPIEDLWGVGERSGAFLRRLGIKTIGELACADPRALSRVMGIVAEALVGAARGEDASPVVPYGEGPAAKSLGHEHTVSRDVTSPEQGLRLILALTDKVARDLREERYVGRRVVIKMRTASFRTLTRQRSFTTPTNETRILYR